MVVVCSSPGSGALATPIQIHCMGESGGSAHRVENLCVLLPLHDELRQRHGRTPFVDQFAWFLRFQNGWTDMPGFM